MREETKITLRLYWEIKSLIDGQSSRESLLNLEIKAAKARKQR